MLHQDQIRQKRNEIQKNLEVCHNDHMLLGGERKGEGRSPETTRRIFWILAFVAVVGWFYIFLQSELFQVHEIVVEGAKMNDPMDVKREVFHLLDKGRGWQPWQSRHLLFLDLPLLSRELKQSFYLEEALFEKEGKHILRLKIKEYPHRLVIYKNQKFYWVDLRGEIDGELTKDERQAILMRVYGKRSADVNESPLIELDNLEALAMSTGTSRLLAPDRLKQFISLTIDLQRLQLPYREFHVESSTSTKVALINEQGTPVYFDFETLESLQRQLQTYKAFWDSQRGIKGPQMYRYIDVRVPEMIYLR